MKYADGDGLLSSLSKAVSRARFDQVVEFEGVTGPATAAATVDLYRSTCDPVLLVTADEEDARRLLRQLSFLMGLPEDEPDFIGERPLQGYLPDDLSPYENRKFLPQRRSRMELMATLYCMTQPFRPAITVTSAWGLMRRTLPKSALHAGTEFLLAGIDIERDAFLLKLAESGYISTPIVEDPGTFSVRGSIIDVFSPMYSQPLRLDFFGDVLETIRLFSQTTQKSIRSLEEAYVVPVREAVFDRKLRRDSRERIYNLAVESEALDRRLQSLLMDLDEGLYSSDLDPYLPLIYKELAPLFAYLSSNTRIVMDDPLRIRANIEQSGKRLQKQHAERSNDCDLLLEPGEYVYDIDEIDSRLSTCRQALLHRLRIERKPQDGASNEIARFDWDDHEDLKQDLARGRGRIEVLEPLIRRLREWLADGYKVFLVAHTETQARRLIELLEPYKIATMLWLEPFSAVWKKLQSNPTPSVQLVTGQMARGQIWKAERVILLCEEEIFGERKRHRVRRASFDRNAFLSNLDEISEGDFIVHIEFGVGVYKGLVQLEGDTGGDYLLIEYLANDKLYLPVTQLEKVQKYSGSDGAVPRLDRLGGSRWAALKSKAKKAIWEMAEELVKLYAERKIAGGKRFSAPDTYYREFEAAFPYEETPDQDRAIKDVLSDMQSAKSMDRLVCGDVGFGKTEVALRAAMKAVLDKRQVAVLVPTTVLALQHEETFKERFENYPVSVEMISRFKTAAQIKESLQKAKNHRLDILIGTHRLLSKDVEFGDLGLLIVDEEHRFGVAHKEKIKQISKSVDVLTLTATPIPRTLNMAFSGLRDISVIQTPPTDRLSIRTIVSRFDEDVIREAIQTELSRGGQVFLVHNRVGSIDAMASLVKRLVPAARVSVGHGQMGEKQLEKVMMDFVRRKTNVLVCTTIIESGIDIPTVNTMIVNRADTFGLAQLYQLRGRVGRGRERAYAYLMVPSPSGLSKDAQKRLSVLMRFTDLGSGFRIASHDMEIRGAGNLLGRQQHGHIAAIGLDLYLQLIDEVVRELKGQKSTPEVEPQVNLYLPAYLPRRYIADQSQRLAFYKRLSSARSDEELDGLIEELRDRFGRPPEETNNLVAAIELKILLRRLNAAGIDLTPANVSIQLGEHCKLDPDIPVSLATRKKSPFRFTPDMKLTRALMHHEMESPIATAKNILHELIDYGNSSHSGYK